MHPKSWWIFYWNPPLRLTCRKKIKSPQDEDSGRAHSRAPPGPLQGMDVLLPLNSGSSWDLQPGDQWTVVTRVTSWSCLDSPLLFSCYFFYPKSLLCLPVPSFNKRTVKITWTRVVKSLLHEVENPNTTGRPEAAPLQTSPCPVIEKEYGSFSKQW